ncbi:sensor histidine kinase [Saccharomonospora xinjiangensis]|uniref:sensor histidine kinase n=1 Tax=Saccharomonospora xinjiangensis TaxID=75294 RepID=UPI00106F49DB|nr:sensor histidine kinase [Saccharomonospora xinjiangensis]QBQ62040.1 Sensor histidine kinase DesK [Saccharomonospora xinjiangensis]
MPADAADARPLLTGRLRRGHLTAFDAVVAVALTITATANLAVGNWNSVIGLPTWSSGVVSALLGVPIVVRRRAPTAAFASSVVLSILAALGGGAEAAYLAPVLPLHAVASLRPRRVSVPLLGVALALGVLVNCLPVQPYALGGIALCWTLSGAAWTTGRAGRERRHYAALAAEQRAREAVADERLRIARDMHDVVAHSLSLIAVKAGVAHHLAEQRPAEARSALGLVESTAREALDEMRTILGVLRSGDTAAELAPAPGLAGLDELAERAGLGGVRVELSVDVPGGLPGGVALTVYRVVQEALTNAVKHAAGARCTVAVTRNTDAVFVEILDDGAGPARFSPSEGHGLRGMRERVSLHGGKLEAGPRRDGGFRVAASIPTTRVVSGE